MDVTLLSSLLFAWRYLDNSFSSLLHLCPNKTWNAFVKFKASRKQRQFGFILCHVCSQAMPTSTLFLSGSTWKLRKISIWLISWLQFLIHCGPLAICKDRSTLTGLFWGELSSCVSGSVFIFKKKFFVEMQAEFLVTAEAFSLPPGKRCLQGKIKLEKKLPSANWWGTFLKDLS